ncbi:MAG: hypothetical protein SVN78_00725 [Deferribacterota bacterium]|nr:hypothetical protein [Deferribacterota bacterium]
MAGIVSYGAYVPMWRIDRSKLSEITGIPSLGGERSVTSWDEDSISMAVEAGLDCLGEIDPKEIDGLYFATVSSPLKEKQASSIIASALDLRENVFTGDITTSTKAGVTAVKIAIDAVNSGNASKVLVIASESRLAEPKSFFEQIYGDGATALLIGKDNIVAEIEGFNSINNAIPGVWRRETDVYPKVYEPKLDNLYGFLKDVPETVSGLLKKCNIEAKDISKIALYAPDPRAYMRFGKALNIDLMTQLENPLFEKIGMTGTPHCLLLLALALEKAKPDQRIVCIGYGDGCDAFLVKTTDKILSIKGKSKINAYISSKRMLPTYGRFADFKDLWKIERSENARASVVKYWRDRKGALPLYGMRCKKCNTLQYPIKRCCIICSEKDNFEEVKLSRNGKVFSYTHDYLLGYGIIASNGLNPATRVIVDLDDGCRLFMEMSDHELDEVDVGMDINLTFRLFHQKSGFPFYYWRVRPAR